MKKEFDRRELLRLAGLGGVGVVVASNLWSSGCATPGGAATAPGASAGGPAMASAPGKDFVFLQLSDTHWGFKGPPNPLADKTLPQVVSAVNAAGLNPDFVVFTGDLTHTTESPTERRARLAEFKRIVSELHVKEVHFLPGEHDASLDKGEAFEDAFGPTHYAFDHQGVRFVALDNVSDPQGAIGEEQLAWLEGQVRSTPATTPLVILTHRPLFDLFPAWDWATKDGARAVEILSAHPNVTVFYGHIHQAHHHQTGAIQHHAASSLVFALPAPGSQPKRAPLPWDADHPWRGLGWRDVRDGQAAAPAFNEHEVHPS
jgi:3',5'-cyclic AMP phosphodiesterase CpdA